MTKIRLLDIFIHNKSCSLKQIAANLYMFSITLKIQQYWTDLEALLGANVANISKPYDAITGSGLENRHQPAWESLRKV